LTAPSPPCTRDTRLPDCDYQPVASSQLRHHIPGCIPRTTPCHFQVDQLRPSIPPVGSPPSSGRGGALPPTKYHAVSTACLALSSRLYVQAEMVAFGRPKTSNKTGRDVYNSPSQKGDNNPHLLNTNCAPFSPKSGEGK